MFKVKEEKWHSLLNTQIPTYLSANMFNINNAGNQTSPIPFSGSATLDPEWVVTALQAASGLPWKQGSGWRLWLKSPSQLRQSCRNAKGISVPRLLFSQTFRSFEQLECRSQLSSGSQFWSKPRLAAAGGPLLSRADAKGCDCYTQTPGQLETRAGHGSTLRL